MSAVSDAIATARHVHDAAAADLELILGDIARWVAHESPSGATPELDLLAGELAQTLTGYGLLTELVPSPVGLHVHAVLEGSGRARVALLCHHDTVFPLGTVAGRPLRREGDRLLGPGTADMKGGIAVARTRSAAAGRRRPALRAARARLRARRGGALRADRHAGAARGLRRRPVHGVRPAGRCGRGRAQGWPLARRRRSWTLGTRRIGARARAQRRLALARELPRIAALDRAREGLTLHVTRMHGGDVLNSVPGEARATIDMRGWHEADLDWAEAQLLRCDQHRGIAFTAGEGRLVTPPLERTPAVAALAVQAAAIGAALGSPVPETSTGGVSDGCWTAGAGLPTLDGLGPVGALDHSPDEYIEIASLAARCGLIAGLVAAIDGGLLQTAEG